jgi:hypothetical protein
VYLQTHKLFQNKLFLKLFAKGYTAQPLIKPAFQRSTEYIVLSGKNANLQNKTIRPPRDEKMSMPTGYGKNQKEGLFKYSAKPAHKNSNNIFAGEKSFLP